MIITWAVFFKMAASRFVEVTDEVINGLKKMHIFQIITYVIILKQLHLLLFISRKYAIICTKSQTIMRKYVHLRQSAFNCAKCTLHKDICIIVNIQ